MRCLNPKNQKQKKNLDDLFARGVNFFKNLTPSDKIALIYHMDIDGVCSAAIVHVALKKLNAKRESGIKISKNISSTYGDIQNVFDGLQGFNKVIILDIGVDQDIEDGKEILLIDHHLIKRDMNSKSTVFINPRFKDEKIYQPASYVVYKLLSSFLDMEDSEWLSAMGIVSDMGYEDCMDVLSNWVDVESRDELFDTDIGQIGNMVLGASYELGFDKILPILIKTSSLWELKENEEIVETYKKYEKAFESGKKDFWDKAESFGNVIFSIIKPKYRRLSSPIINRISFENRDKAIFILEDIGEKYKISARYQNARDREDIHLGKLMRVCCKGGGHKAAAGGSIKKGGEERFKQCVLKELRDKL